VERTQAGKIKRAPLRVDRDWMIENFLLAIDLAKGFITSFAPPRDRAKYAEIADALWSLRDRSVLATMNPDESDTIRCVQAFMGKPEGADILTDFDHLSTGSATQDGHLGKFMDMRPQ
jgi:hypothetical protein